MIDGRVHRQNAVLKLEKKRGGETFDEFLYYNQLFPRLRQRWYHEDKKHA